VRNTLLEIHLVVNYQTSFVKQQESINLVDVVEQMRQNRLNERRYFLIVLFLSLCDVL